MRSSDNGKIPSYNDSSKSVANVHDNVAYSISKESTDKHVDNGNGSADTSPTKAEKVGKKGKKKKKESPKMVSMKQLVRFIKTF